MDMDEIYGPGATLIGGQIQLGWYNWTFILNLSKMA
jgi:hypothetical protein